MVALSLFEPRTLFAAAAAFAAASFAVLSTAFAPPYRHRIKPEARVLPEVSSLTPVHYLCCIVRMCLFNMDVGVARSLASVSQILPCVLGVRERPTFH
jgi:hypothetical protein